MSESGDQQELTEVKKTGRDRTVQEKIIDLYNSGDVSEIALGVWAKLIVEMVIVALPLAILIIPGGFILAWLNVSPITYFRVLTVWGGLSITVLGIVWCFIGSEVVVTEEERDD